MTSDESTGGVSPTSDPEALMRAASGLEGVANVDVKVQAASPSASLDVPTLVALYADIDAACRSGAQGVVVTTGTDTLEEAAYFLDLIWPHSAPVVMTGAMRVGDPLGADGPANLVSAVSVAMSTRAAGRGCLVVMNDEIHRAATVRKLHTQSLNAFGSPAAGPVGYVREGEAVFNAPVPARRKLVPLSSRSDASVALLKLSIGDDTRMLEFVATEYDGIVLEALGGGHVPAWWVDALLQIASVKPIVLASRTGNGSVLRSTYAFPGSEQQLLQGGLPWAGNLDGLKARVLLKLAIMSSDSRETAADCFGSLVPAE